MTEHLPITSYLREKQLPTIWCPGCGIGIVLGAIIRAIKRLELSKDKIALVSGIGCTGRMTVYADFNTLHTTHGRALAFATGLKLVRPELTVLVVMGDGDALAIGGNHFLHTARRNLDLTAIIINNGIYGMTGGQIAPTTPVGAKAVTAPYGNIEPPFDITRLAEAAGASFVARSTVYHVVELERVIAQGIEKKGGSVIEVLSDCPVQYGDLNDMDGAVEMLQWYRENTSTTPSAGKILRGVLVDRQLPEYGEEYRKMVAYVRQKGRNT